MNKNILSVDVILIKELCKKPAGVVITEPGDVPTGTSLQPSQGFGSVDLWKIRGTKKRFRNYQASGSFSI